MGATIADIFRSNPESPPKMVLWRFEFFSALKHMGGARVCKL